MHKLACMLDLWLFEHLNPDERMGLESMTRKLTYQRGELLFREGSPADMVMLVTTGRAELFKVSASGRKLILGFLGPHDLLGEDTLFQDEARTFSAEALERTTVCACAKKDFEDLASRFPTVFAKVTATLGQKLNAMTTRLADMALYDVKERLIRTLAFLIRDQGAPGPEGWLLDPHITHEDLGALVGASRVMVTNVLANLRDANLVQVDTQRRLIVRPDLLNHAGVAPETPRPKPRACACYRHRPAETTMRTDD